MQGAGVDNTFRRKFDKEELDCAKSKCKYK